ncbi:MAG: TonB-dependent receptor [Deltaproteobacteria bacterium]|nr:TonB-dependent receptor [Deltaproteobacteria bacterium]
MRKLQRELAKRKRNLAAFGSFAAAMAFAAPSKAQEEAAAPAATEPAAGEGYLEEIIVTSQKRSENVQDVPISITALGTQELEDMRVDDFDDYAKLLPSLSFTTSGPGFSRVFFRGVSSGDNGNHSGSQPTVGQYLDEQPITTIQGALDVHVYDIERVEALAGPQGTLYGASSQSGTIRIITNKPDPGEFAASYGIEGNLTGDEPGYVAEGMVNVPIGEKAAIRLVGWAKHEGGYIDNVFGTRTYPTAGYTIDNDSFVEKDYNDVDTYGGRVALRVDLNDSWTVTPTIIGQLTKGNGGFNYAPSVGKRETVRFRPENGRDGWMQAAMTVEGSIANLDVTYAGAFLLRNDDTNVDYSDYSYFYDLVGYYLYDSSGTFLIDPTQYTKGKDRYRRHSHEIRIATPQDNRLRFIGGFFFQRQQHRIEQRYVVDDLDLTDYEVTGWDDTIWLTEQKRVDRDYALFGEGSFDVVPDRLIFTGGIRLFRYQNSLKGYFGFADDYSGSGRSGETLCSFQNGDPRFDTSSWVPFKSIGTAPCTNLDQVVKKNDYTPKVNLTYRIDDDKIVYATWSKGFRPGGVNRNGQFPPYKPDFLTNYEGGVKTSWFDNRVRVNAAFFWQKWKDFQFSYLGPNGLTILTNAGGARIWGVEADFDWAVNDALLLSGGVTILDAELTQHFCKDITAVAPLPTNCSGVDFAARGTTLPIVPDYKLNLTARYNFDLGRFGAYAQASGVFQGSTRSALIPAEQTVLGGRNRDYELFDLSLGIEDENWHAEIYLENVADKSVDYNRSTQCDFKTCTQEYITTNTPRTVGIKFGQKF